MPPADTPYDAVSAYGLISLALESPMLSKRVAVVGSRKYPDLGFVREFVRRLARRDPGATIVSGNAPGVDRAAEVAARAAGLGVVSIPADWDAHGRGAGFVRNGEIVQKCDAVAAFWDGNSKGTADTVGKAEVAGKSVSVWGPDGGRIRGGTKGMRLHLLDSRHVSGCERCRLCETRRSTVFGQGDPDARLMFVGEAPGHDEDESGLPFVGRAGQRLTKLIEGMGLSRDGVFVINILKCRPPGNRDPEPAEVAACSPFLFRQLEIVAPDVMVALGSCAARLLLGTDEGIGRLRGRFHDFHMPRSGPPIPLMPTYHPAYLLRSPGVGPKIESDLRKVASRLSPGR